MSPNHVRGPLLSTMVLLLTVIGQSSAQLLVNTPGGMRSVPVPTGDLSGDPESAGVACNQEKNAGCVDPTTSEPMIPVELQVLTGDVLYESLFPNLEAISEQDKQTLMSTMMALQNSTNGSGSSVMVGNAGAATVGASNSEATESDAVATNNSVPAATATAVLGSIHRDAATETDSSSTSTNSSSMTSDIPSDVASMPVLGASGQTASQVDTAAGTVAATIPVMGQYAQVIVSSLKMLPINAEQFSKVSGTGATALSWEQDLEEALITATANATTIPAAQIETKLTCVLNLGLELPEPPAAYAAAAATAIANKLQVLANDQSVLVGVSLIRLGSSSGGSSNKAATPAPASAAVNSAWLDTSAAADNTNNSSSSSSSSMSRKLAAVAATKTLTPNTTTASAGSALVLLSIYGVDSPANAVDVTASLQKNCPGLLKYGSSINSTSCGADILNSYTSAINAAAAAAAATTTASSPAAKRLLLQAEVGTRSINIRTVSTNISTGSSLKDSSNSIQLPAVVSGSSSSSSSSSSSNFSAGYIKVRQQPEVNIIISQAVGITAAQPAADVVLKLQAFSSSFTLPQVLADYGLAVSQAGIPQIVEIQSSSSSTDNGSDTATPLPTPSSSSKTPPASSGTNNVVIGVAVAAVLAVTAVSAAAVAIVVVKQRARAAKARAAAAASGLPHKKHRKGGKAKGIQSKYLPTTVFSPGPPGPESGAGSSSSSDQASSSTATPAGLVAVQLPASLAHPAPILSPTGTLLLPQTGLAAAAAAAVGGGVAVPMSPQSARSGPLHGHTPLSPAVSGGQTVVQQLTRGDSVSSAVRFDLEVDNASSSSGSSDGDESEGEESTAPEEQQQQQLQVVTVGATTRGSSSSPGRRSGQQRAQGGSRLLSFVRARQDSGGSSRMEATLSRSTSGDELPAVAAAASGPEVSAQHAQQQVQEVHVIQSIFHSQLRHRAPSPSTGDHLGTTACGSRNCSSSGCRFSSGGCVHSRISQGGSAAATPRWWTAAAEASIALMSAAAGGAEAGTMGSANPSEPFDDLEQQQSHSRFVTCQHHQQHGQEQQDAACVCVKPETSGCCPACPRLFSRSLSAASLQVFEAAAAAATKDICGSSSRFECIVPITPMQAMHQQHILPGAGGSGTSGDQFSEVYNTQKASTSGAPLVHIACCDQLSSWGSSNGAASSSDGSLAAAAAGSSEAGEKLLVQQEAAVLRPLSRPLVSPFQMAANVSFMLESL